MDWDLWGPCYDRASQEEDFVFHSGWQYGNYRDYGLGQNLIEEDAINEKCCIHVLKCLIAKADSEIDELEKELIFLQSELAWNEHKEWPDICCSTLRKRIDDLQDLIKSLTNKSDSMDAHLQMPKEHPQKLPEILRALLEPLFKQSDNQVTNSLHVIAKDSTTEVPGQVAILQGESTGSSTVQSDISHKGEGKELSLFSVDKPSALNLSSEPPKDKTNCQITGKDAGSSSADNFSVLTSLESQTDNTNLDVVDKALGIGKRDSSMDTLKYVDHRKKRKTNSESDTEVLNEELQHCVIPSGNETTVNSSLQPEEKAEFAPKKKKIQNTTVEGVAVKASRHATGSCNDDRTMMNAHTDNRKNSINCISLPRADPLFCDSLKPEKLRSFIGKEALGKNCDQELKLSEVVDLKKDNKEPKHTFTGKATLDHRQSKDLIHIKKGEDSHLSCTEDSDRKPVLELQHQIKVTKKPQTRRAGKLPCKEVQNALTEVQPELILSLIAPGRQKAIRKIKSSVPSVKSSGSSSIVEAKRQLKHDSGHNIQPINQSVGRKMVAKSLCYGSRVPEVPAGASGMNESLASLARKKKRKSSSKPITLAIKGSTVSIDVPHMHGDRSDSTSLALALVPVASEANCFVSSSYSPPPGDVGVEGSGISIDVPHMQGDRPDSASLALALVPAASEANCLVSSSGSPTPGDFEALSVVPGQDYYIEKLSGLGLADLRATAKEQKLKRYSHLRKKDLIERLADHFFKQNG